MLYEQGIQWGAICRGINRYEISLRYQYSDNERSDCKAEQAGTWSSLLVMLIWHTKHIHKMYFLNLQLSLVTIGMYILSC